MVFWEQMLVLIFFQIVILCWHEPSNLCASAVEWWVKFVGWLRDRRLFGSKDFPVSYILSHLLAFNILENSAVVQLICLPHKHLVHILRNFSDGPVVVASYQLISLCPLIAAFLWIFSLRWYNHFMSVLTGTLPWHSQSEEWIVYFSWSHKDPFACWPTLLRLETNTALNFQFYPSALCCCTSVNL